MSAATSGSIPELEKLRDGIADLAVEVEYLRDKAWWGTRKRAGYADAARVFREAAAMVAVIIASRRES